MLTLAQCPRTSIRRLDQLFVMHCLDTCQQCHRSDPPSFSEVPGPEDTQSVVHIAAAATISFGRSSLNRKPIPCKTLVISCRGRGHKIPSDINKVRHSCIMAGEVHGDCDWPSSAADLVALYLHVIDSRSDPIAILDND